MPDKIIERRLVDNIQRIQIDIAKIEGHLLGINENLVRTDVNLNKLEIKVIADVKYLNDKIEKLVDEITRNKIELAKIAGVSSLAGIGGGGGIMLIMKALGI